MKAANLIPIVLACLFLAACNTTDQTELARDTTQLVETSTRAVLNASTATKVTTALALRKGVDLTNIRVSAEGGTVTLTGTARTNQEKQLILEIARETRGVEKLVDNLKTAP